MGKEAGEGWLVLERSRFDKCPAISRIISLGIEEKGIVWGWIPVWMDGCGRVDSQTMNPNPASQNNWIVM